MFVYLLGSPRILIDQRPVEGLRRKNRALIFYLAAHHEAVTRDQLLALFWPDEERPAAQQILRTMLHDLRKHLGENTLIAEEDRLKLAPTVQVDAQLLDAALASPGAASALLKESALLKKALDLYRGDFLDGFTLADTSGFDDWVLSEREYYRAQAIRGYTQLSHYYENAGDLPAALEALARGLAIDPLREDLQRDGLRLRYRGGDRAGAIRQYEAFRRLLDEELGVPPMPETRAVYDAIITDSLEAVETRPPEAGPVLKLAERVPGPSASMRAGHPHPSAPEQRTAQEPSAALALPFTRRAVELEMLGPLVSAKKLILVEGPPGIGKTRLINEFLHLQFDHEKSSHSKQGAVDAVGEAAGDAQALVLRCVAHELEQGLPYQPVIDGLRGLLSHPDWPALRSGLDLAPVWLAEIALLLPELQTQFPDLPAVLPGADEARLWEGLNQFLGSLSRQRPVILFLDDLHWADASTLGLAGYLARRAVSPAILLVGTSRPVDAHTRLAALTKTLLYEDRLLRIPLAPLTAADTRSVAERLSPQNHAQLSQWLERSAEGNPYFLTELVRHAYHTSLLQKDGSFDPAAPAVTHMLPPTIQNLTLSRLMRLSENARRVLDTAAVIGREFNFDLVYRILSPSEAASTEGALLDALNELQSAVLIQPRGGDSFSFDHSLTMEVVLQDMGELRSRILHRQAAQALELLHAQHIEPIAGIIVHHYVKSGSLDRAAPFAFRAGQYSAGLAAWEEAIAYYQQALRAELDAGQRTAVWIALGTACFHKGEFAQASKAFTAAIDLARPRHDLANLEAAYMGLNLSLLPQSRFAEAIALGRELALSGPPELAICAHFIWASGLSVESAHPDEAERHLQEAERLLEEHPGYAGHVTLAHIKYQLAGVVGQQGKSAQAVALYREAQDLVRENASSLDLLRQIMLYNNLAYHLLLLGDPSAAEYARAGIQLAQERGSLTHLPYLLSTSGEIALGRDDLDEAERFFREGLRLAEQVPIAERIAGLNANLGLVAHRRGEDELARQRLFKALELADQLGSRHLAVRIRCWLVPILPPAEASACLEEARSMAEQSGFHQLVEEIAQMEQEISEI